MRRTHLLSPVHEARATLAVALAQLLLLLPLPPLHALAQAVVAATQTRIGTGAIGKR